MEKIIAQHLPQIKALIQQYTAESACPFGSAATGTIQENSDIDCIIKFPDEIHYAMYAINYFALADALEALLNKKVELVTEKTLKNPYLVQSINRHKL